MVYTPTKSAIEIYEEHGAITIPHLWVDAVFNVEIGRPVLALGPDANGYVGYRVPYPTQGQPIYLGQIAEALEEDDGAQYEKKKRSGASNRTSTLIKGYDPTIASKILWAGNTKVKRLFATGNGANQLTYRTLLVVYENLLDTAINKIWAYRFYWNVGLKTTKKISGRAPQIIDMVATAEPGFNVAGCPLPVGERYYKDFYSDASLNPTDDEGNLL